ncbi:hypothetical protein niasHT_003665 [Heterodera trifolii]|uniref:Uncharacterized protein n=1 Tax=Heterodera trifolii TaxID=157864 RepID=A0ABD2M9H9_9BILA
MDFAIGRIVLKDECRKEFFATADQLQEMASEIFAAADKQTENGKFFEKGFDIFCCTAIKAENDAMEKDELALIDEFEANQRNFCHQLKKGQNIWEAVESSAGNVIVTAARNVKISDWLRVFCLLEDRLCLIKVQLYQINRRPLDLVNCRRKNRHGEGKGRGNGQNALVLLHWPAFPAMCAVYLLGS